MFYLASLASANSNENSTTTTSYQEYYYYYYYYQLLVLQQYQSQRQKQKLEARSRSRSQNLVEVGSMYIVSNTLLVLHQSYFQIHVMRLLREATKSYYFHTHSYYYIFPSFLISEFWTILHSHILYSLNEPFSLSNPFLYQIQSIQGQYFPPILYFADPG